VGYFVFPTRNNGSGLVGNVLWKGESIMTVDIPKMKKSLEQKRDELRTAIAGLTEAQPKVVNSDEASEGPQDFEEVAVDFLETHKEQSIQYTEQALLAEVQAALKRIDDGRYGICVVCGQPIPERRLEAIPWAARCIQDEAALEKRNLGREELYDQRTSL
jgi:DnaK suppressor protein